MYVYIHMYYPHPAPRPPNPTHPNHPPNHPPTPGAFAGPAVVLGRASVCIVRAEASITGEYDGTVFVGDSKDAKNEKWCGAPHTVRHGGPGGDAFVKVRS